MAIKNPNAPCEKYTKKKMKLTCPFSMIYLVYFHFFRYANAKVKTKSVGGTQIARQRFLIYPKVKNELRKSLVLMPVKNISH